VTSYDTFNVEVVTVMVVCLCYVSEGEMGREFRIYGGMCNPHFLIEIYIYDRIILKRIFRLLFESRSVAFLSATRYTQSEAGK